MVANSVLDYSFVNFLYLEKNITNDLKRFLKLPSNRGEEDIAVPFTTDIDAKLMKNKEEVQSAEKAAESSKEE